MIREALLSLMGLKAAVEHRPATPAPSRVDVAHNQAVHDLHNQEAVALAGFQLQVRKGRRVTRGLALGDAVDGMVSEINDDAARMRAAMQTGFGDMKEEKHG